MHCYPLLPCRGRPAPRARRAGRGGIIGLLVLLHMPGALAAGPDPYLQAINAEGNRLESLGKARQEQDALMRQHPPSVARSIPARSSAPVTVSTQKQFEDTLRTNFPGSYALYSIMSSDEQREVYAEFQKKDAEGSARFIPVVVKIIAITSASSSNRARAQKQ